MNKKIIVATVAFVLATGMTFGLTACANNGAGTTTGGSQHTVNKKLTEAEWKTAVAEVANCTNFYSIEDVYQSKTNKTKKYHDEIMRDDNIFVLISDSNYLPCYVVETANGEISHYKKYHKNTSQSDETTTEQSDWIFDYEGQGLDSDTEYSFNLMKYAYGETIYYAEIDGEEKSGKFSELYSALTYDESECCYNTTMYTYAVDDRGNVYEDSIFYYDMKIFAENGHIVKITDQCVESISQSYFEGIATFGGVKLENPIIEAE